MKGREIKMYDKLRRNRFLNAQQIEDILDKFHKKQIEEKKKNYTWLFVVLGVVGLAAVGFGVYKFFFAPIDEFDDEYDDDYDDIDFDEDYDEDYEDDDYDDETEDDSEDDDDKE